MRHLYTQARRTYEPARHTGTVQIRCNRGAVQCIFDTTLHDYNLVSITGRVTQFGFVYAYPRETFRGTIALVGDYGIRKHQPFVSP